MGNKVVDKTPKRISGRRIVMRHLLSDILALILSHLIFIGKYTYIKTEVEKLFSDPFLINLSPVIFLSGIVLFWLFAFYLAGNYHNLARRSGMQIIGPTLFTSFIVTLLVFYFLIGENCFNIQDVYLQMSIQYFFIVWGFVFVFRMVLIRYFQFQMQNGQVGYYGILIGNSAKALELAKEYYSSLSKSGFRYVGYISEGNDGEDLSMYMPHLGTLSQLPKIIKAVSFDDALIVLKNNHARTINRVINTLKVKDCFIRLSANLNEVIERKISTTNLEFLPYITIVNNRLPIWQVVLKRVIDVSFSLLVIILFSPLFILLAVLVKFSSPGAIFYRQIRIGKNKKPFMLYKYRSMYVDAEKDGPALSSKNDPRITSLGKYLRKWHLDELPQFFNVIMGDMSLVGPRPERRFFIDQILTQAPHYDQVFSVKPGITSWGMVKFGYAENVEEMIQRLQYDIIYLENRTLVVDLKILLYTFRSIFKGDGK
ncbi:sugar transferase [Plebeiibacterium sediminum]|uniref:Sugar transferase n=1 Tax=Plebeiibacterium sediminum TaxID=2992112 RepID=A0AAE3M2K8_9BACT|nr:sugar transferase [Plebeiobacterium sediminum]MCW3785619.1 sugar transferase [Plebeiobacterium sediminum]